MYVSNPQNADFGDLRFDFGQRLITRQWIYCINGDIIERLSNAFVVDVYTNLI